VHHASRRWLYSATAAQQLLQQHGVPPDRWRVHHGRVTDLWPSHQRARQRGEPPGPAPPPPAHTSSSSERMELPVCVNLVVAEALLEDGGQGWRATVVPHNDTVPPWWWLS
jgi:hypothetical protein